MDCEPRIEVNWPSASSVRGLYRRVLFRWPRGLQPDETLPKLECSIANLEVSEDQLESYRFVTHSLDRSNGVPLMFPHAVLGPTHLQILAHSQFPFSTVGLLHLRNHIIRYRAFGHEKPWNLSCTLARQRSTDKGLEFDFDANVAIDGEVVWRSVSTYLKRCRPKGQMEESYLANLFAKLPESDPVISEFGVPHNIGIRYAEVTQDYNPIHVSTIAAKLFGFRGPIAHGMWSVARAIQELGPVDEQSPLRHDVAFKGPMFVNSRATIKAGDEGRFDIYCGTNPRPVIIGAYQPAAADELIV